MIGKYCYQFSAFFPPNPVSLWQRLLAFHQNPFSNHSIKTNKKTKTNEPVAARHTTAYLNYQFSILAFLVVRNGE